MTHSHFAMTRSLARQFRVVGDTETFALPQLAGASVPALLTAQETHMIDLLQASPSVGSYKVEPMSIDDIDAHPDGDRIWATIRRIANEIHTHIAEEIEAKLKPVGEE